MSDANDSDSKTEEATEKKLADAIEGGHVPMSREAPVLASLAAIQIAMIFVLPTGAHNLAETLMHFIDDPGGWHIEEGGDALALINLMALAAAGFLAPIVGLLIVFGVSASMAQNAPRFVFDRILPDFSRISIAKGLTRIYGFRGLSEFFKTMVKFVAVVGLAVFILNAQRMTILNASFVDVSQLPGSILGVAAKLVAAILVATLAVASVDIVWARIHWRRDQRMTRQEVKEEVRQMEGDRLLKARLRSIRLDRSRRRMLTAVPRATMVIVNPTHYAVALRYVRSEGGAPIVVAKGVDLIALKIREIATDHAIPLVEDKPLARSLHDAVKVDAAIPPEFYRAVAELVHLIQEKRSSWPLVRDRRTP